MEKSHDISVLNGLIETTLDSYKGYNDACADDDGRYRPMFQQLAQDRSSVTSRLQQQVAGLGGDPEDESSYGAAAHRGFMDLKQAVMGSSEQAIIEEVERGEDYLKAKYEAAMQDDELSPDTRQVIQQAYQSVREGHDRVSSIKHQMEG